MLTETEQSDSDHDTAYECDTIETISQQSVEWKSIFENITDDDICDMEEHVNEYIYECLVSSKLRMSAPDFYNTFIQEISQNILEEWTAAGICQPECEEPHYDEIVEMVDRLCIAHFEMYKIPLRQEPTIDKNAMCDEEILSKLSKLNAINDAQAKQRTIEWYESRYNLLTASNLWKVFGSPAQYNSLIYEKCKPLEIHDRHRSSVSVDSNSTLQHGIRYEPLSILLYEREYGTRVSEVGCIPHPKYSYIGASPDGILMDPTCPRYGRMVEVKNIVNREITGVPLEHYWIQMQLQMEVCDLDECDFIETRFLPIETIESLPVDDRQKGMILYFYPRSMVGNTTTDVLPEYAYLPLNIAPQSEEAAEWTNLQCDEHPKHILYKKSYWVLDQFSCVLVRRNREWFCEALPKIEEAWNTILTERRTGYDHRATYTTNLKNNGRDTGCIRGNLIELRSPESMGGTVTVKKQKFQPEVVCSDTTTTHYIRNMPFSNSICLIKLDGGNECGTQYYS